MNQREEPNIDELLNSLIDGELTQRQRIEVQRLILHDVRIAKRLRELQKCKVLVGSLPHAEAPAGMAEQIKASLQRGSLLARQPVRFDERKGARHLLVRNVLATAAMIGLVAILAAVIYTIVAPQSGTERPVAVDDRRPARKVEIESLKPSIVVTAEKSIVRAGPAATKFTGRLELKTNALIAVSAFINRAIEDNGLLEDCIGPRSQRDQGVYAISCSRQRSNLLLANLENIWQRLDSATLFVETDQFGERVVVGGINAGQIAEIVNQDSLPKRVKVARDFAVLNNMAKLLPGREVLAAIDDRRGDLITIPKPVLTSSEKTTKKPASRVKDTGEVNLTIVVVGSE